MKKKYIFIGLILVLVSILALNGKSYAKYVSNVLWNYKLESLGFYFSSPDLGNTRVTNINNNWAGEDITFSINNGLNDMVTTNYDISYQVTCSVENNNNARCVIGNTNTNTYRGTLAHSSGCINNTDDGFDVKTYTKTQCEVSGYEWIDYLMEREISFNIESETELTDVVVNINVSSTSPYVKNLYGRYVLHKVTPENERLSMEYVDIDNEGYLIVSNSYKRTKCATISFDSSKIRVENNDNIDLYRTSNDGYINEFDFTISNNDSIKFNFYEKELDDYDDTSFTLIEKSCN